MPLRAELLLSGARLGTGAAGRMDGREGCTDRCGWSATAKGSSGGRVTEGGAGLRPRRSAGGDALRWSAVPEQPRHERPGRATSGAAAAGARGGGVGVAGADGLVGDDHVERAVHGDGPFGELGGVVSCKVRL